MSKVELKNIFKVFGKNPKSIKPLIDQGLSKQDIFEKTGHTLGLRNINLSVDQSQTLAIIGLSGSGKSTLIRHVNRLIDPTFGKVLVDGEDLLTFNSKRLREVRSHKISMVFQKFGLFPHRSVIQNVAYGLKIQGRTKDERRDIARQWIDKVGLAGYEDVYPSNLSGGMQQRVGIARAFATNPEILLLDEPFSALDPLIRQEMQTVLGDLQKELKKTVIFITHDIEEAFALGDKVAILNDGELIQTGRPEELIANPADDYVRAFVESANRSE